MEKNRRPEKITTIAKIIPSAQVKWVLYSMASLIIFDDNVINSSGSFNSCLRVFLRFFAIYPPTEFCRSRQ